MKPEPTMNLQSKWQRNQKKIKAFLEIGFEYMLQKDKLIFLRKRR